MMTLGRVINKMNSFKEIRKGLTKLYKYVNHNIKIVRKK